MNKLTAEKCREMLTHFKSLNIQGHLLEEGKQILQALEIALPVLEQQDGWISCSDRMPGIGQQVLVTNRHFHIYEVAIFDIGTVSGKGYFGASSGKFIATHWQPLTAPPQSTTDTYRQIENDGWIEWGGFGGCPVHDDVDCVEIKTRAGLNFKIIPGDRSWLHYGNEYDIIAYRVVEK